MVINVANLWICYLILLTSSIILWAYVSSFYPKRPTSVIILLSTLTASILTFILSFLLNFEDLNMSSSLWFFLLLIVCLLVPLICLIYGLWTGDLRSYFWDNYCVLSG